MTDETYEQSLSKEGLDLVKAADAKTQPRILFREDEVEEVLKHIDAERSVLLTGPEGAGKDAVVHAVAQAMSDRGQGQILQLSNIRCLYRCFDTVYNLLLL